jgi:predicted deacylase
MRIETIELRGTAPGTRHSVQVLHFGTPGAMPKAYVHGAIHADEVPAMLVAQQLRARLEALESQGQIIGEVVLVPFANPMGLAQQVLGQHHGRFDLRDGGNFNRGFPDLSDALHKAVQNQLGPDALQNTRVIRSALRACATELHGHTSAEDLKIRLLQLAIDADVVLDLHCDTDAVMHLYALTPHHALAQELGAALGARAVLLATDSGGAPFDEACTRPWFELQQRCADVPIALACFAATVELRGECDTSHDLARQDADGLVAFLRMRGVLGGRAGAAPMPLCDPTPLAGSEPVVALQAGVIVFHRNSGDRVEAGDTIADLVDPLTGAITPVPCNSSGVLYARCGSRWAHTGKRLAKIAGTSLARTGALLSP